MTNEPFARLHALVNTIDDDVDEQAVRRLLLKATIGTPETRLNAVSAAIDRLLDEFGLLHLALLAGDGKSAEMSRRSLHDELAGLCRLARPDLH